MVYNNIDIKDIPVGSRLLAYFPKFNCYGDITNDKFEIIVLEKSKNEIKLKNISNNNVEEWFEHSKFLSQGEWQDLKVLVPSYAETGKCYFNNREEKLSENGKRIYKLSQKIRIYEILPTKQEILEELSLKVIKFIKDNNLCLNA